MTEHKMNDGLRELVTNVEQWAEARNLIGGATVGNQFPKLVEEAAEQSEAIESFGPNEVLSETGDVLVVQIIMSAQMRESYAPYLLCAANGVDDEDRDDDPMFPFPEIDTLGSLGAIGAAIAKRKRTDFFKAMHALTVNVISNAVEDLDKQHMYETAHCPDRETLTLLALSAAWGKIKDRTGRMVDGVFVKEADL